ncbi:MAG TPA: methyltransferase domain-containing protein [Tepidisphaeraceae bacterium]
MEPLRLHVGGHQVKEGWKILNIQQLPGVEFVGSCTDLSQFAANSVDEVYASHVYEHLGYLYELPQALREVNRVLKPGGIFYVGVPDLEKLCTMFVRPEATIDDRFNIMRMMFGGQMDAYDYHKAGLTLEFMQHLLKRSNFSSVERVENFGLFEDLSSMTFHGEPISLNVIARK